MENVSTMYRIFATWSNCVRDPVTVDTSTEADDSTDSLDGERFSFPSFPAFLLNDVLLPLGIVVSECADLAPGKLLIRKSLVKNCGKVDQYLACFQLVMQAYSQVLYAHAH